MNPRSQTRYQQERYQQGPPSDQSHSQQSHYYHHQTPSQDEHAHLVGRHTRVNSVTTQGVANGNIGGGYGPYSYAPGTQPTHNPSRFSNMSNASGFSDNAGTTAPATPAEPPPPPRTNTVDFLWNSKDPDLDDPLHNPDPVRDAILDRRDRIFTWRGLMNLGALFVIAVALVTLFAGYPIAAWYRVGHPSGPGYNLGGINGTGQIPVLNVPRLIDPDTPQSAYTRTGFDGQGYSLVFSDEFNTEGRSFYEGDDPFWEAVDLHNWSTGDLEWYSPDAVTTQGGNLVITMTETPTHGMDFRSGMLQSWNKFCFTTGYIEVNMSLPGPAKVPGLWPAAWTMGNLGRIGHGGTTDGVWPFSYDTCDYGTYPNQTKNGIPPEAVGLSYQPGQRLSACTCPHSDHPGPSVNVGRGAPEIDIVEVRLDPKTQQMELSQSFQVAPFDQGWNFNKAGATIYNSSISQFNSYAGGTYQEAVSAVTLGGSTAYDGKAYQTYGFEYWSDPKNRPSGYVTWSLNGQPTWTVNAAGTGPDNTMQIGQRIISEEPMSIALNLAIATSFQEPDYKHLVFPTKFRIDYVRVYQRDGHSNIGCDPKNYPTADYINRHIVAYTNPNITVWSQANYTFPRNSQFDGC